MSSAQRTHLFSPLSIGSLELPNRLAMAPMTRNRTDAARVPGDLHVEYYRQRAGAGLLITEATSVSPQGVGYVNTPGIWNEAQQSGWRRVTEAVHAAGGRIFLQLWHVGRTSHRTFQPKGELPVSSSAVGFKGELLLPDLTRAPYETPRALETHEIPGIVKDYENAARRAKAADFDGVELHAANSYLIDQFLRDGVNHRDDAYGGPAQNRARFLLEVLDAVQGVWGRDRVAVRLSPLSPWNGMSDSNPFGTFRLVARELKPKRLAYLHVIEPVGSAPASERITPALREAFGGPLMVNGGYTADIGEATLAAHDAELVSFGVPYIANPDLAERFRSGAELNTPDQKTFYGGDANGYIDYPVMAEQS